MKMILIISLFSILSGCSTVNYKAADNSHKIAEEKIDDEKNSQNLANSQFEMIDHKFYQTFYNKENRLAVYVKYNLTAANLKKKAGKRKDNFKVDPFLKSSNLPFVMPKEYDKTGYDKGHLAPAADFSWSQEATDSSFFMSNMVPQKGSLNRGPWKKLEDQVRKWGCGEKEIIVITGPVLKKNPLRLPSGLEIPDQFFKIVIDETPPKKVIAFLYKQVDKGNIVANHIVPIIKIQEITGIALNKIPDFKGGHSRLPASLNDWKEEDCD